MNDINAFLRAIGAIVAVGGGSAAIAYAVFVTLWKQWLENRFARHLEELKHEKAKELEHVRHDITSLFSRVSKIHDKEFAVLPSAWDKLQLVYGAVFRVASSYTEYPDLNQMTPSQLEAFVASCRLPDFQKDNIRAVGDKTTVYQDAIFWVDLHDAKDAQREFHNCVVQNRIFMNDDLRGTFNHVDLQLSRAIAACDIGKRIHSGELLTEGSGIVWNLGQVVEDVERAVQQRLHYADA